MAWSSGTFSRIYNWVNDASAAIDIEATRMDGEDNNFATGINACLTKDGSNEATQINVDNLRLDGNTISSTDTNGDINITPNGTGEVVVTNGVINTYYDVDAFADLASITGMSAGDRCRVKYHTTEGDGGGGDFRYDDGESAATYTNNGGTIIRPSGGDGSAAWLRVSVGPIHTSWFGAVGSGTETTAFQNCINATPSTGTSTIIVDIGSTSGDYTIGTLTEGSRSLVWILEHGVTVTQGELPSRVFINNKKQMVSTPAPVWSFGETPHSFTATFNSASGVASQASSGGITLTHNGINSGDRLIAIPRVDAGADGLVLYSIDPGTNNSMVARFVNPTAGTITPNNRECTITIATNPDYRQVFALTPVLGKDVLFCGVDMQSRDAATIWKSINCGSSWVPLYASTSKAIREFIVVDSNTDTGSDAVIDNTVLALLSDPGTSTDLVLRTTDGGATWAAITLTLSGSNVETLLNCGDVEGGQFSGNTRVLVGALRTAGDDATVYLSTDAGASFGSPIEVDNGSGYDFVWSLLYISGSGVSSVWLAFLHDEDGAALTPAVYRSSDGGSTWSSVTTVGSAGVGWQAVIKTSQDTLLASTEGDGEIFRSTDSGTTWTEVFEAADIVATETKFRRFAENDGVIYAVTQDGGYLWSSFDDGLTWQRECRAGRQFAPICFTVTNSTVVIGGGQGFTTSQGGRAEVYVANIEHFNDSEF